MLRIVSVFGLLAFVGMCWCFSTNRRRVNWRTVGVGLAAQLVLGVVFLGWDTGNNALRWLSGKVDEFLKLSLAGSKFVFGMFANKDKVMELFGELDQGADGSWGFLMAFQVLPTIIFFGAFMAVLYHLGVMQGVVRFIARFMVRFMGTSGSESLSVSANIFVGQTEAPLLIKPFLPRMTNSELMAVMCGGFATIAGGVFALYVGFGVDPGHLIVASVMSAPAALVVAKILVPETEESETYGTVKVKMEKTASNVVEAATNGATDGLKLALNVGAMLIAFLALIAVVNWILAWFFTDVTLEWIFGWIFSPLAFLLGVDWQDVPQVGQLLGIKIAANEAVAYGAFTDEKVVGAMTDRSKAITTFALCGFANLGSIGIQIGGIAAIAPERRADLARLGFRAMMGGAFASWMTAAVAGILL